jgi:hypothetical protein
MRDARTAHRVRATHARRATDSSATCPVPRAARRSASSTGSRLAFAHAIAAPAVRLTHCHCRRALWMYNTGKEAHRVRVQTRVRFQRRGPRSPIGFGPRSPSPRKSPIGFGPKSPRVHLRARPGLDPRAHVHGRVRPGLGPRARVHLGVRPGSDPGVRVHLGVRPGLDPGARVHGRVRFGKPFAWT